MECSFTYLLRGELGFNQSIGLMHFCRIGYKLLQHNLKGELAYSIKSLIIKILKDLEAKSNLGAIRYEREESRSNKDGKLKLVIHEYLCKYES